MAEIDKKILLSVEFTNPAEIAKKVVELKTRIAELVAQQKNLDRSTKEGKDAYASLEVQIKGLKKELGETSKYFENIVNYNESAKNSYERLSESIKVYSDQIKKMSEEQLKSAEGQEMILKNEELKQSFDRLKDTMSKTGMKEAVDSLVSDLNKLNSELKNLTEQGKQDTDEYRKLEAEINNVTGQIDRYTAVLGDNEEKVKSLKQQKKELVDEMQRLDRSTEEGAEKFASLAKEAGRLQSEINETNNAVKRYSDSSIAVRGLTQATQGLVAVTGLLNIVTSENDGTNKAMLETIRQMQIVLTALNSLQTINNALKQGSAVMQLKNLALDKAATVQKWALAKAETAAGKATIFATVQQKIFNAVAAMNPYLLIFTGIGLAVGAIVALAGALDGAARGEKALQDAALKSKENTAGQRVEMELLVKRINDAKNGTGDLTLAIGEYNTKFGQYGKLTKDIVNNQEEFNKILKNTITLLEQEARAAALKETLIDFYKKQIQLESDIDRVRKGNVTVWERILYSTNAAAILTNKWTKEMQELEKSIRPVKKELEDMMSVLNQKSEADVSLDFAKRISEQKAQNEIDAMQDGSDKQIEIENKKWNKLIQTVREQGGKYADALIATYEQGREQAIEKIRKDFAQKAYKSAVDARKKLYTSLRKLDEENLKYEETVRNAELSRTKASAIERFESEQDLQQKNFNLKQKYALLDLSLTEGLTKKQREAIESGFVPDDVLKSFSKAVQAEFNALQKMSENFKKTQEASSSDFFDNQIRQMQEGLGEASAQIVSETEKYYDDLLKEVNARTYEDENERSNLILQITLARHRAVKEAEENAAKIREGIRDEEIEKQLAALQNETEKEIAIRIAGLRQTLQDRKDKGLETAEVEKNIRDLELQLDEYGYKKSQLLYANHAKELYKLEKNRIAEKLKTVKAGTIEEAELRKQLVDVEKDELRRRLEMIQKFAEAAIEIFSSLNEVFNNMSEMRIEIAEKEAEDEKERVKQAADDRVITRREAAQREKQIEKDLQKVKAEEARKQAIREKSMAMFQIAVNTAMAIMKIWGEVPKGDFGASTIILTALAAALGTAQLAAVASKPIPKAARGRLIRGRSHSRGGELVEAEGGEIIINKRSAAMFAPLLSEINRAGGGVPLAAPKFNDGGFAFRNRNAGVTTFDYNLLSSAIADGMESVRIFTSVQDMDTGQKNFARTRDLNTH